MAINVPQPATVAAKWANNAGQATPAYVSGIQNPSVDQAAAAVAAASVYAQAVQAAITSGSYAKGVQTAGTPKWQAGALGIGQQRYAPGIQAGKTNFTNGITPVLNALAAVTLPPRNVKGNNAARSQAVVDALMKMKSAQG